jgi:acyl transferase domain-containing protein/acyl carrier protein
MSDQEKDKLMKQLKEALVAIRKLKTDLRDERARNSEPLAVIGMSMRFPGGVKNAEQYWKLLSGGIDAITDIPADRFNARDLYDPELSTSGKINVLQGGFIDEVDRFDGSFFDITPIEIESMDPQQRIMLELTHEAMENAGLNVREMIGSNTGVYVGIGSNDYQVRHFHSGDYNLVNPYSYTGSAGCAIAGRISYMMGLQGPSMSIDTACSASIIAAHVGSTALRNRECDMAVIGGVNLMLSPEMTICFSNLQALSPDSRCKTFDNSANGYVRSEGSGVLVLKRLSDARKDGDNIMALIRGSASNQDGRSNGFTAPNVKAQIDLIKKALADAGLRPADIDYIEAHGTGTRIGDPIEIEALASVFQEHKSNEEPLLVGSVKSNIGHLESAAGMASMIKAVLCLQHGKIPQSIHYREPNDLVDWDNIPIRVADKLTAFDHDGRYIGISGFGITGTNGHIIMGEVPETAEDEAAVSGTAIAAHSGVCLLPLSAKTPVALRALVASYAEYLSQSDYSVEDICSFTALKRAQFPERKLFVAEDKSALLDSLLNSSAETPVSGRKFDEDESARIIFVFSGQGAQWPRMGLALAETEDVFRAALEECNEALKRYVDWDVFEELAKDESDTRIKEGDVMQPLLMAVGVALARWWQDKGLQPDTVIGHSMGEVAAAHIAGHITLDEAARIITARSQLMEAQAGKGMMLATDLTAEDAAARVEPYGSRLSISVLNSPSTTVIGGEPGAIEELMKQLESEERWCRKVRMTVAAHTAQMDPVLEPLAAELDKLSPVDGPVRFYSSSQDREFSGSELNADYWKGNVRNSVQFGSAIRELANDEAVVFIEIGPHAVLTAAIEENIMAAGRTDTAMTVSSFYRDKNEIADLYSNLGALYRAGIDIDWSAVHVPASEFIMLPNYPWQKERYWFDEQPVFRGSPSTAAAAGQGSFYSYEWQEKIVPAGAGKRVLMIGWDEKTAEALRSAGHHVEQAGSGQLSLPEVVPDIILLVQTEDGQQKNPSYYRSCLVLQDIIQKVTASGWQRMPSVSILTKGVYSAENADVPPFIEGAMLWGMVRTMRNEYPEISGLSIDADRPDDALVGKLLAAEERGEYRVSAAAAFSPKLIRSDAIPSRELDDRQFSCFLITGGTSGLGLSFAEWLAAHGVDKIALVSRSGEKPETAAAVQRMTAAGAEVKIFEADVSDATKVGELMASIEVSLGMITGVVHAAGLVDDGTIANLQEKQFAAVARPKVDGTLNLHHALINNPLTHFIVFSSAATVLGTMGQANYNAANFYMDRLMEWRKGNGLPATTVCWGNIGVIGMAAAEENRGRRFSEMGFDAIEPVEFDQYFHAVFRTERFQVIPMKIDFGNWVKTYSGLVQDPVFSEVLFVQPAVDTSPAAGRNWGSSAAAASRKIGDMIKVYLAEITKIPINRVKEDETFKSMGLDSMMALQLRNTIQEDAGLSLAVSSIWAHPTVEKYTAFLVGQLGIEDRGPDEDRPQTFSLHQLKNMVRESVAGVTKLAGNRIKESDTFKSMGIDSMQALQIRNALQAKTGITLPASSIWAHPTVEKYAAFLAGQLGDGTTEPIAPEPASASEIESDVQDMSLDELMQQLENKSREH